MDTGLKRRGQRIKPVTGSTADSTPQKKCRFCKGLFTPNPNQARHDFCQSACRKDFYKYGAFPAAKFKADIQKHVAKIIASELAPLRSRLASIEDRLRMIDQRDGLALAIPEAGAVKRSGGAAA